VFRAFPCKIRAVPMQGCSHAGSFSHAGLFPCRAVPMQAAFSSQGISHAQQLVPASCWEFVGDADIASLAASDCTIHTMFAGLAANARYLKYVHKRRAWY